MCYQRVPIRSIGVSQALTKGWAGDHRNSSAIATISFDGVP
jgi:hypothetical protein